jgi:hypothetical protein
MFVVTKCVIECVMIWHVLSNLCITTCNDRAFPLSLIILLIVMDGMCNLINNLTECDYMACPFSLKVSLNVMTL